MEKGWPVFIYAKRNSGLKGTHQLVDRYRMLDKAIYLPVLPRTRAKRASLVLSQYVNFRRAGAIKIFLRSLNLLKFGREAASLKLAFQAIPFLNRNSFDILHCQFGWLGEAVCQLRQVGAISGKLVTSFRGYDTDQYLKKKPSAYRNLFEHGDLFLPVCDYFKQWLIANGCPANKIKVLRSGVNLSEFNFHVRKPQSGKPIRLLSIARMVEKKGLTYALEAVAKLIRSGKNIHYTIIGDGPMRTELERYASILGIVTHVSMPGMKPHTQVLSEIHSSHILLATSVTAVNGDQEGIPNALKEAMATGMPVVSTWHAGIPELVVDQEAGFLVKEKDVDALSSKLEMLIDHPDLWGKMGKAGRTIVERDYNINSLNGFMVELYRRLHYHTISCRGPK